MSQNKNDGWNNAKCTHVCATTAVFTVVYHRSYFTLSMFVVLIEQLIQTIESHKNIILQSYNYSKPLQGSLGCSCYLPLYNRDTFCFLLFSLAAQFFAMNPFEPWTTPDKVERVRYLTFWYNLKLKNCSTNTAASTANILKQCVFSK